MPTTPAADFGVVQFMRIESFVDPNRGLDREARVERLFDFMEEPPTKEQLIAGWPHVRVAIRRGGLFVIESETPAFTARLSFCPEAPDTGDYEIHHRPRGGMEKGRTVKVVPVATDEKDASLCMLTPFATRYLVVTVGSTRPYVKMVWLVGLRSFQIVDEMNPPGEAVL